MKRIAQAELHTTTIYWFGTTDLEVVLMGLSEMRALQTYLRLFSQHHCSFPSDGHFDGDFCHPGNIWRIFWREQLTSKGSSCPQSCHVRFFTGCQRGHQNQQDHTFSRHGFSVTLPITINTNITSQWMNFTHSPCRDMAWGSCNI